MKINYTGKKYGYLTLLSYARAGGQGVGAYWWARCDCGKVREILAKEAANGRLKTCGECEFHSRLTKNSASTRKAQEASKKPLRRAYSKLGEEAARSELSLEITLKQFQWITEEGCFYCLRGDSVWVERTDPAQGYTPSNCHAVCRACRKNKGNLTLAEYLGNCIAVVNTFQKRLGISLTHPLLDKTIVDKSPE